MANDQEYILSIDVSSLNVKIAIVSTKGELLASVQKPYVTRTDDEAGFAKAFDMVEIWTRIVEGTREVLQSAPGIESQVIAIVPCAQRIACVFLDEDGNAIYGGPNQDARGVDSQFLIEDEYPEEADLFKITGRGPPLVFALARLLWFREEREEDFARIKKVLMLDDWIAYKLSGRFVTDPTAATDSQLFDIAQRAWCSEIIEKFDLDADWFPEVVESGTGIGTLSADAADQLSLPPAVIVVKAGGDSQVTILGAGCVEPYQLGVSLGSTATANVIIPDAQTDPEINFWTNCYVVPKTWVIEANAGFSGRTYNWFKDNFLQGVEGDLDTLVAGYLRDLPPGANATFAYLGPQRMAIKDQTQIKRSAFVFPDQSSISTLVASRATCAKALFENLAFGVLENIQALQGFVPEVTRIFCGGGMTKSKEFMEMLANVLGQEVYVPVIRDSAFVGAVISALVALGKYPSHQAAVADIVQHDVFTPDEKISSEYQKIYKQWATYKAAIDKL